MRSPIIKNTDAKQKYVVRVEPYARFVVGLGEKVEATDIEEGMRVGINTKNFAIEIPLPNPVDVSGSTSVFFKPL